MVEFLSPKDGPVVEGLEWKETVFAKDQPEYIPLRALVLDPNHRVVTRWTLTDEQRRMVAEGADIFLELLTFGNPLQPVRMVVSKRLGTVDFWRFLFGAEEEITDAGVCGSGQQSAVEESEKLRDSDACNGEAKSAGRDSEKRDGDTAGGGSGESKKDDRRPVSDEG